MISLPTDTGISFTMSKLLRLFISTVLLVGCASTGPRVTSNINPNTDFSGFATYNFMQPLGTDRPGGIQTPLSTRLISALGREMESRGYRRSDSPDLLVNVFVNTERRMDVRQVPTTTTFHGYRSNRYSTWGGYHTEVREYTKGTLAVDLVDVRNRMLAWEGKALKRLNRSATELSDDQINNAVSAVMAEFPFTAAP
jgi:hypothetical protein